MKIKYLFLASTIFALVACGGENKTDSESSEMSNESESSLMVSSESSSIFMSNSSDRENEQSSSSSSSSSKDAIDYDAGYYQNVIESSKPTKIVTTQTYNPEIASVALHFNSVLVVEYGSTIKSSYSYSYEKLNEIGDDVEGMISVVSGSTYSDGSKVGDGVQWVNKVENATLLNSVDITKNVTLVSADAKTFRGNVVRGKEIDFFGQDFGVQNVVFTIQQNDDHHLGKLTLEFDSTTYAGSKSLKAHVVSVSTYHYDLEKVEF